MIIYLITNIINNKKYVGVTKHTGEIRFSQHVYSAINKKSHYRLHAAMRKYGIENFICKELCSLISNDKNEILEMESFFIELHNSFYCGYNANKGGYGLLYHKEETKKKMSDNNFWKGKQRFGNDNPMFGKKHSEEAKLKISEKNKGKQSRLGAELSQETKNKIGQANKNNNYKLGYQLTVQQRKNISDGKKGKVSWTKKFLVTFPNGHQELVFNLAKFCRDNNLSKGNMCSVSKGKFLQHKGYRCELIADRA